MSDYYNIHHDIHRRMQEFALAQTAEFVMQHLSKVKAFGTSQELLKFAFEHVPSCEQRLLAEFGVGCGKSLQLIAELTPKVIYGFDSFQGLPEVWRTGFEKGAFKLQSSELSSFPANVQLIIGWFSETLPGFLTTHKDRFSFVHLDCDLYSSTKTVLDLCADRITSGTVLVFDEFFNYPGWQQGEYKAFNEFVTYRQLEYTWLGYCWRGEQVAVQIV